MATQAEFEMAAKQLGNKFTIARYKATKPHNLEWVSEEIHDTIENAINEIRILEEVSKRQKAYYTIFTRGLKKKILVLAFKPTATSLHIGYRLDEGSEFIVNEYNIK